MARMIPSGLGNSERTGSGRGRARRRMARAAKTLKTLWAVGVVVGAFAPAAVRAGKAENPSAVVQKGLLRIVVRAPGVVAPGLEVPIHARAAGEIIALPVRLGQTVKKGQLLLEIDSTAYARRLAQAKADDLESSAQLRIARLRLDKERSDWKRAMAVAEAEVHAARRSDAEARRRLEVVAATSYTLEVLREEIVVREAATTRTRAAVEAARADLANTRLVSPIDGAVTDLAVVQGGVIAPAAVEVGLPALTVSDLSRIAVAAEIDENRIRDIQLNLAASVSLPAFPERSFLGRIVTISPRGQRRGETVVFPIRIELEGDPGDAARFGLTAGIEIVAIEKPDALLIDRQAVRMVGKEARVTVLEQGKPDQERTIKIGRSDGVRYEVLEGLKEGDRVALPAPPAPPAAP